MISTDAKQKVINYLKDSKTRQYPVVELTRLIGQICNIDINKITYNDLVFIANKLDATVKYNVVSEIKKRFTKDLSIKIYVYSDCKLGYNRTLKKHVSGKVVQVNDYFVAIETSNYVECFDLVGFSNENYIVI